MSGFNYNSLLGSWAYINPPVAQLMHVALCNGAFRVALYDVDEDDLRAAIEGKSRRSVKGSPFLVSKVRQRGDELDFNARYPGYWAVTNHSFCRSTSSDDELIDMCTCPDRYVRVLDGCAGELEHPMCGLWKCGEKGTTSTVIKTTMGPGCKPAVAVRFVDEWEKGFLQARVLRFCRDEMEFEAADGWVECRLKLRKRGGATCYWTCYGNVWRRCNVYVEEKHLSAAASRMERARAAAHSLAALGGKEAAQ